ncbi:MAG: hypothetical protein Q8P67_18635, partial [archaeon]|nr:hypothetical protein [archaeon]
HKSSTPGSAPQLLTNVISCTVRCSAVMDRSNCFEILVTVPLKKNVIFSTDTNAERFEWIRRIRSNIDLLIDAHVKRTKASAKQNAAPSKINDPAIRQILDQPGNNECADCSLPGPEWVCMSRGVFLCSTCGSIHRRLSGQAIISLSRGRWSPEKLRGLQALPGNLLSNELYEKHIPSDVPKPLPTSSNSEKTRFIQLKYTNAADERVERALSIRRDRPRLTDCDLGGTFTFSDSNGSSDASSPSSSLSSSGGGTIVIGSHQARLNSRKQEGLLYKRSAGGNKEFHGVLRTTKLDLYTGADRKKRNSSIPLNLARVLKEPSVDSLTFKIVCPTREYVFSVKAPSELENWISGLSKAIEQLKSHSLR